MHVIGLRQERGQLNGRKTQKKPYQCAIRGVARGLSHTFPRNKVCSKGVYLPLIARYGVQ